jgi:membrane-anchored protein YejM (alkaline phosphatase superfamily)
MKVGPERQFLFRWIGWVYFIHIALFVIIELTYLFFIREQGTVFEAKIADYIFAWSFLAASYFAHAAVLYFFCLLPVFLTALIVPRKPPVIILAGTLSGIMLFALMLDRLAYQTYQMHHFTELLRIFSSGVLLEIIPLSLLESLVFASLVVLVVIVEIAAGSLLYRMLHGIGHAAAIIVPAIIVTVVYSYAVMASVTLLPETYRPGEVNCNFVYKYSRLVPYYTDLYFKLIPGSRKNVRYMRTNPHTIQVQIGQSGRELLYPLKELSFNRTGKNLNFIFIMIDMWRFDAFKPDITPSIAKFSEYTLRFQNHRSGGNCTKPGIFSLFYALPENYWDAMIDRGRGPLFIKECIRRDYECVVFSSATLEYPEFKKTVFIDIAGAERIRRGDTSVVRDRENTDDFIAFLENRQKDRPLFAFLFYDAAHNFCEGEACEEYLRPFQPAIRHCKRFEADQDRERQKYINRYQNAIHYIDGQVGRVLDNIKQKGMLGNSIIIITSDHGAEFNERNNGNRAYATAYSSYQLHVPMIIFWPGGNSAIYGHATTHMDLVPTLMQGAFGCKNPSADYAYGDSLFKVRRRPYLVAGSYSNYAIVTDEWTLKIFPNGDYLILDSMDRSVPVGNPHKKILCDVFEDLNRYYR